MSQDGRPVPGRAPGPRPGGGPAFSAPSPRPVPPVPSPVEPVPAPDPSRSAAATTGHAPAREPSTGAPGSRESAPGSRESGPVSREPAADSPEAIGSGVPRTGDPEIDLALRALSGLDDRPLGQHHDELARAHEALHRALNPEADGRVG